jgi:hypothetical protein
VPCDAEAATVAGDDAQNDSPTSPSPLRLTDGPRRQPEAPDLTCSWAGCASTLGGELSDVDAGALIVLADNLREPVTALEEPAFPLTFT